jgi:hypothetical protein
LLQKLASVRHVGYGSRLVYGKKSPVYAKRFTPSRAGVAITIPLSLLFAFIVLHAHDVAANLLSIGAIRILREPGAV